MILAVLRWLFALGCAHEWIREVDGRTLRLRCRHCLITTRGIPT